ncbi:TBC1 domain, member 5, partial [Kickxella alabastrina]
LFGLRWFRLLYGREIAGLHSLLLLWDALLADAQGPLQLVDWVGIVMVLANRRELIASDYADCLATLLHLPPLPRPVPETLERTPVLPNTPLPAGSREEMGRGAQRLPLAALAMPDMAPVQRLALQAAYLRSRPVAESAQAVAAQYALWESESWAVVEGGHEAAEPVVAVIDSELPQPQPSASPQPKPKSPASGSRSARKTYTIGTLQQRRTAGGSGSGSGASTAYSPPAAAPSFVPSPVEGLRSPNEVMCSLGSLTAQIACLAAQCADLLALRHDGRAVRGVAAGLHTLSRVWQDEIARSPGALDVRPQALSDADLRVVLRDLDSLHAELTQRM